MCTRNTHARIFASRQCTDYVRTSFMYAGAGEVCMARVTFTVGPAREKLFVVSKPQWHPRTVVPDLHLHRQSCRPRSSIWVEHIRMCQSVWRTYGLYQWYVTTFRVTFLSVTHHVRTHVCTYVPCENRSWIQSLALMRSAIKPIVMLNLSSGMLPSTVTVSWLHWQYGKPGQTMVQMLVGCLVHVQCSLRKLVALYNLQKPIQLWICYADWNKFLQCFI